MIVFLCVSAFCVLFNYVYSFFGHGVTSIYMTYAFAIPAVLGFVPYTIMVFTAPRIVVRPARNLWNSGIAALSVGSISKGVFEIAGTSSAYEIVFLIAGAAFLTAGLLTAIILPIVKKGNYTKRARTE